ncbi:hypothetical protein F5Y04DRAFT_266284 [Hypomontagnella monticulosa]|nr:hypothetical protein F5Y04DRAFT_266284 [Hypomontagnella monticulosa]
MLADILHSLANDANDSDGVAQLVVTALGSCGQHYICWKTHSGEYRQQSHGLPKQLQDWLFPTDGSTRDFETLQVILSGEDTFWASDRNGEVRSEPPNSQQRLRRALTFSGENLSATGRRRANSRARELLTGEAGDLERPRSSTLPSVSPTVDHLPGPHLKLSATHGRSSSADKLRKISLVPLAFHQKRRSWATRPRSLVYGHDDLGVLKEQPSPQRVDRSPAPTGSPTPVPTTARGGECPCGCHHDENAKTHKIGSKVNAKPRTGYTDASVQTDPSPDADSESTDDFQHRRRRHHQRRESSLSATSTVDSFTPSSYASSKRSSFETITTQPDPGESYLDSGGKGEPGGQGWQQHWEPPPNPVIMGRMQEYFRSSNYTLGAALQPQGMI